MIRIAIQMERLESLLTVDEFLAMQDGDLRITVNVMAKFVMQDDEYLSAEDGRKAIGRLTLKELKEAAHTFGQKLNDAAVPPTNANAS